MVALNLKMKLLIDPKAGKVLFAEAGKDVVDFLLSILSLPLGLVGMLQDQNDTAGSIGNLYQNLNDLMDLQIIPTKKNIDNLLDPPVFVSNFNTEDSPIMLLTTGKPSQSSSSSSSSSSPIKGGFVKRDVSYMITDDLVVKPMSTISTITTLFKRLNLNEVGAIEEKMVNITVDKVNNLLEASLKTKNVLTNVFFKEKVVVGGEKSLESVK